MPGLICVNLETMNQLMVEQRTGLSREVLRKWELRYSFPQPTRGARGQRIYTHADVEKLLLIKRLMLSGLRPGQLVQLSMDDLQQLLKQRHTADRPRHGHSPKHVDELLAALQPGAAPYAAQPWIKSLVAREGLDTFIHEHLPVFNRAVGDAWAAGQLPVHAEHHYSETVRRLLVEHRAVLSTSSTPPRVLLSTPPGELHELGVLALEVALAAAGAYAIYLGAQSSPIDLAQAAQTFSAGVVAVSMSSHVPPANAHDYIVALREALPSDLMLWVGGTGAALAKSLNLGDSSVEAWPGVTVFDSVRDAVGAWQALASPGGT